MEHHTPSGMYYNWYDPATGEVVTTWPGRRRHGLPVPARASTTAGSAPPCSSCRTPTAAAAPWAKRIFDRMRWDMFYDANSDASPGCVPVASCTAASTPDEQPPSRRAPTRATTSASTRMSGTRTTTTTRPSPRPASRATSGSSRARCRRRAYYATWRTFPARATGRGTSPARRASTGRTSASTSTRAPTPTAACTSCPAGAARCSRSSCPTSSSTRPAGRRTAGAATTRSTCAPSASTACIEAGYGYWGFSPSSDPVGGYREYGVDALGLNPDGYFSDEQKTNYDAGFGDCRPAHEPDADVRRRGRDAARVLPRDDARAG